MEMSRETFKGEIHQFRATLKEDQWATAEKSLTLERKGNVGVLVFDEVQEKANKLSSANMLRFFELLTEVEKDSKIRCLVILSRKPSIFIAGADIAEIQRLASGEATVDSLMKLQAVFTYLENIPIPTVAAIHGACLGGGMELALACDYRMATDSPETRLGLPEVMLGLLPGWGGTQRMPRLIGIEKSLDLILSGRHVDGKKAKKMGLVDKVVPKEFLEDRALQWAEELAKSARKRHTVHRDMKDKVLESVPGGKWLVFDLAKKTVLKKSKGHYPAPLKALEVIKKTYGMPVEKGLKVEARAFTELMVTPESKNLIRVFYLNEKVKKQKGAAVAPLEVNRAAVLGAGVMGAGIAQLFAQKGVRVRLKDVNWEAITKGYQAVYKIFRKQLERKKLKPNELNNAMARVEGTTTYSGFKSVDLVVEAAVEVMDIKKKIFHELQGATSDRAILATNTSSLSVTELATVVTDPSRVVGMHFFNPVEKMPLVEVIRGAKTSDVAVATVFQLAKKLGKTPIVVSDSPGFVVNRILGPYLNEAVFLMGEGVSPTEIDRVLESFGMPMGPCTLLDEVGLDVATKVSSVLFGAFGDRLKPPPGLESVVKAGRVGKKGGKGIYNYDGKSKTEDSDVLQTLRKAGDKKTPSDAEIQKRCIYLMVNEAARCLEEKVVTDVSDIDVGMIFGTGFAPFRGGLLRYADDTGVEQIVSDLDVFSREYGARFAPSKFLQDLAVRGARFYKD